MIFDIIAIIASTFVLMKLSGGDAAESLPVAIMVSLAAVIWNFLYNTAFEAWERRKQVKKRTLLIRSAHAIGFEGGLVLICLPLYMIWYDVGLIKAFMMEAALLLFFLVYTFVFTLGFDKIFTLPHYDKTASASWEANRWIALNDPKKAAIRLGSLFVDRVKISVINFYLPW